MALNLCVSTNQNCSSAKVFVTNDETREAVQAEYDKETGGEEIAWDHLKFKSRYIGQEILEAMAFTADVQNMLEEFATEMFRWGQKFERERLRRRLGLEEPAASDQSA